METTVLFFLSIFGLLFGFLACKSLLLKIMQAMLNRPGRVYLILPLFRSLHVLQHSEDVARRKVQDDKEAEEEGQHSRDDFRLTVVRIS